jgi:threonine dehydrogenase-like Zn-dependent dehydrogenase
VNPCAVTYTGPLTAELLPSEPDPSPLGPTEVAGRTLYTLISAGTELAGAYHGPKFPRYPGYAASFQVEAVGEEVTDLKPGDLAFCMGPHRSWQRLTADRALPIPVGVSADIAPFCRLMGVSMTALTTTNARPPETALVSGLGLVGHMAAQNARVCGYEVTCVDPNPLRRELAAGKGLKVLESPPQFESAVNKFALALECSGHEAGILEACKAVRKNGEIHLIGCPWTRRTDLYAQELLLLIFQKYLVLRSGWEWELPMQPEEFRHNSIFGNYEAALRRLADGRIDVSGLYELRSPAECQGAFQDLLHGRLGTLAITFDWTAP